MDPSDINPKGLVISEGSKLYDKIFAREYKVLGQKYPSDRWLPSYTSKNPTSPINRPSTTMPPQKTGYLTEFEKGQIVALRKKVNLFFRNWRALTSS